jgi:hypothetical protein
MQPLTDVLGPWHEFYACLGTASATMVGLLFVAATVGSGVFSGDRRAPLRVFLSASVVNFSLVLAACLTVLAPVRDYRLFGGTVLAIALFGLGHALLACRDTIRDGMYARMDWEDRTWYLIFPALCYLSVAATGVALALHLEAGCIALAISSGLLVLVGIHNAWDITLWSMTRRQQ